jgi:hypothetical protein
MAKSFIVFLMGVVINVKCTHNESGPFRKNISVLKDLGSLKTA